MWRRRVHRQDSIRSAGCFTIPRRWKGNDRTCGGKGLASAKWLSFLLLRLENADIIDDHSLREHGRRVRAPRPVAAHSHVKNKKELFVEFTQPPGGDINSVEQHVIHVPLDVL